MDAPAEIHPSDSVSPPTHSAMPAAVGSVFDILAIGFGTTVAMWVTGYLCRMPPAIVPSWLLLLLMLSCQAAGGIVAGRYTDRGPKGGLYAGLLSGLVNLLILGSFLAADQPNRVIPSAIVWLPGSILISGLVAAFGATLGGRFPAASVTSVAGLNWVSVLAWVAVGATFLLIVAGGLVTGYGVGLAVVDWPNSFGYSMFLYPLSRMTGGIYYEHAHRLFGSLVGLTTMVLAFSIQRTEDRRWVRRFALLCLAVVITQGVLGGLRVTGRFTFSSSAEDTAPNLALAIVHGVLAQLFLGMMISLAVFSSRSWRSAGAGTSAASAPWDRRFAIFLVVALVIQLVLGALLRHRDAMLGLHVSFAGVVAILAVRGGVRAWGYYTVYPSLVHSGQVLVFGTIVQLFLGLSAVVVTRTGLPMPKSADAIVTTLHQAGGAVLLAAAVVMMQWTYRVTLARQSASDR